MREDGALTQVISSNNTSSHSFFFFFLRDSHRHICEMSNDLTLPLFASEIWELPPS